ITWTGYDNIQGTGYGASFNLTIYKDGDPLPIISQTSTSYTLDMQTASSYIIRIIAEDTQGNVGSEEVITVTPVPKLLPFLMLIIGIAGGAIGAVLFLYWRKQRQWQKTTLMEIPT
ncbi:MAG: hypothetical protein HWN66_15805, partial [Candidatus Helarchaeota archaeon]|nr:hypothetical protein [Candidatus Helarchaeota archaeon]